MNKQEARKHALAARELLALGLINQLSLRISLHFFDYFSLENIHYLHSFLSVEKFKEVNTSYILQTLREKYPAINIAVPVTNFEKNELEHFTLEPTTELQLNRWGIAEPVGAKPVPATQIDCVLVPLLAYDSKGNRVGYGKGFYDKFLTTCRPDVIKIGLSFFEEVERIEGINELDIALDYVVNPKGVLKFKK